MLHLRQFSEADTFPKECQGHAEAGSGWRLDCVELENFGKAVVEPVIGVLLLIIGYYFGRGSKQ